MGDNLSLKDRRAVITGASQGLGRVIATQMLAAGADVALCARTAPDIDATAADLRLAFPQRRVLAQACDVADAADVSRFFCEVLSQFGSFDCLVNNAGIHGPIGPTEEVEASAWERAIAIDLFGLVTCCRHAVTHFKARPQAAARAKIVNLSGGGATAPQPGLSAYGAAKAAVVRFTETLALEVAPFRIDVNAVAPGALATRLMSELRAAGPDLIGAHYHSRVEELHAKGGMPMERAADLCVYLACSGSDGLSGRLISAAWDPWPFSPEAVAEIMAGEIYTLRRIVPEDRGRVLGERK